MTVLAPRMSARPTLALALGSLIIALSVAPMAHAEPHVVRKGQTLSSIAGRYGCKLSELKAHNGLRGDGIRAGQKLEIPDTCKDAPAAELEAENSGKKPQAAKKPKRLNHEVIEGETLEMIALRYGMALEDLRKNNERALKNGLKPGQRLKVLASSEERAQRKITYTIESGDTLGSIARRFGMSTKDLMRMNPGKKPERLRIGDRLTIFKEGKVTRSQAVGKPQHGRLVNGEQMKDVPGAHFRRPLYTWGTNETVRALKAAIAEVRRKHKHAHDLVIGDLSREHGGFLAPHKSHQSGLDADIGFYFKNQPKEGPRVNLSAMTSALDHELTWTLVTALAGPNEEASNVEYMFIGYGVQEKLYKWAQKQGVPQKKLDWLFQYPRGSRSMNGLIRHEPGHDNHIHIRFKCPRGDACL